MTRKEELVAKAEVLLDQLSYTNGSMRELVVSHFQQVEREVLGNVIACTQRYQQFAFEQRQSREFEAGFRAAARVMEDWVAAQAEDITPCVDDKLNGKWVEYKDHEQALAEKDRETQQIREHEFQAGLNEGMANLYDIEKNYQQLMEKAIALAETVLQGHRHRLKTLRIVRANASITLADKLLNSPEAQAFLKERENE